MRFSVLHEQWLLLALVAGTVIMLFQVLGMMMFWRPRKGLDVHGGPGHVPWVLWFTYAAIIMGGAAFITYHAFVPPNW